MLFEFKLIMIAIIMVDNFFSGSLLHSCVIDDIWDFLVAFTDFELN